MANTYELWAEGSQPGDAPIETRQVAVDPVVERAEQARDRLREQARTRAPITDIPAMIQALIDERFSGN